MSRGDHLRLSSQCGICADSIQRGETVVALYRSSRNPASYRCSLPFSFDPPESMPIFVVASDTVYADSCDYDYCEACAASLEAAAVHHGCCQVFTNKCRVGDRQVLLRRLMLLASWRRPWRDAQPLFLPSRVDKDTLDAVAGLFGLPQLCGLPVELLEIIRRYSAHSFFWRSISALRMAAYASEQRDELQQPSQVVALRNVVSWERGGELDKSESQTLPPTIRVTVDSEGISRVERLPSHPQYSRGNYTHTAYMVGCDDCEVSSDEVEVELADGLLRLKLPPIGQVPQIWNTPTPPILSACNIAPFEHSATWTRLFAVEADSIRGITFFYNQGRLCDIHMHYPEGPSAQSTYNKMKRIVQRNVLWLYLPISQSDRLTVIGTRKEHASPSCYLFRLEKSGDVVIGGAHSSYFKDDCLGRGAPLTLIYGEPNRADEVPRVELVGAYRGAESEASNGLRLPDDFPLDKYEPNPATAGAFMQAEYFSWAPLDGVASAVLFRDQTTGCCKGILFHYLNGGSRAIGECRLHVDPAQRVVGPSWLCVQAESRPSDWDPPPVYCRTRATFQHSPQHEHEHEHEHDQSVDDGWSVDKGWKCHPMTGYAKFWFTAETSVLIVTTEQHMETAA